MAEKPAETPDLQKLVDLVARLRAPDGCPWDREQTLPDVRAYLLEEAHELAGAIDGIGGDRAAGDVGDSWSELAEELGDVLFQVAFIGRLAEEAGAFRLSQVIDGVHRKMVERHPHVFGDEVLADAEAVRQAWERRKLRQEPKRESLFSGVPASLPALLAAYRLTQKAAGVGFDWPDAAPVLDKVEEEIAEVRQALAGGRKEAVREEVGDLLFTLANLARKLDVDPEAALAGTNRKFRHRFAKIEEGLAAQGKTAAEATLEEMDALWEAAKRET
jgi:nucleoside triphosphate diphosphatase